MRVFFLTHRLPYSPNRGDRVRAFHIIEALAPRVELHVVSLTHDRRELAQAESMRRRGLDVTALPVPRWRNYARAAFSLAGPRPLTHLLLNAPGAASALRDLVHRGAPDVVLAYCSGMARFAVEPPLSAYPLVVDLVDVDSEKWSALAPTVPWPRRWIYQREARCLSTFEDRVALQARDTLVVNQREALALQRIAPGAVVRVVPNGVDLSGLRPASPPGETPHVVFCGVMNYSPNIDGVLWFARDVWPLVRARRPDARFFIVGSDPVASVRRLGGLDSGIEVTDTVPDVRRYLWNAAVSVAPLKTARGIQNKVLEAVACGLPTVATSQVLEGLPDQVRSACRSADLPGDFAEQTLALLAMSGSARRAIAESADLSGLSWQSQLAPLYDILANAAATRSGE